MSSSKSEVFSNKQKFTVFGVIALSVGLFAAVLLTQQQQDNRSSADSEGNVTGRNKTVEKEVVGNVIGDNLVIKGNVRGDVIGKNNVIHGNVGGCIKGDDNQVDENVGGVVSGSGNRIDGEKGTGFCLSDQIENQATGGSSEVSSESGGGNLIGSGQKVNGDVPGFLLGSSNEVNGNIGTNLTGSGNEIKGSVGGCVVGSGNKISGDVGGTVIGSGNRIGGRILFGACGQNNLTPTPPVSLGRCKDNIDNDNNGFKDAADSSCHTDGNPDNPNSYDPNKDGERNNNGATCSDSKDNDGDNLKDGADPDCHTDNNANNPNSYDPTRNEGGSKPDLIVTGMSTTYDRSPDGSFVCSTGLGTSVSIKNQGTGAVTGSFAVKVNDVTKTVSSGLAVGASISVFVPTYAYSSSVTAIVDSSNQIVESDETNNQLNQQVPVPTQPLACVTVTPPVGRCRDNIDNDNNGFKDSADSSCHYDGNPNNPISYEPERNGENGPKGTCADSIDNNSNGVIDGADPICHTDGNSNNPTTYDPNRSEGNTTLSRCNNNIDDDNNNFKDAADSSCHSDGNPNNPNSYVPTKDGERPGGGTCSDSIDNNGNNLIDGADPICHSDGNPNNPASYTPQGSEMHGDPECGLLPCATFSFDMLLHGIGKGGDNASATASGNPNPLHPNRKIVVNVLNNKNQTIATSEGTITYSSSSGSFKGNVKIGGIVTGIYSIKVKTDQFLRTLLLGPAISITTGITNQMPTTAMINGDINNDNQINILDYNLLLGCYSDLLPATSCTPANKLLSDLDDDGNVNGSDYNLFLRELLNVSGQ